jgi:uncharacterized protein (TIGR02246 family)
MQNNELSQVIKDADSAINREDFDAVMDFYSDDAVLVVKPGMLAKGKVEIRRAFSAIADYFNHSLKVNQDRMAVIETGDTALVIAKAHLSASLKSDPEFSMERISTYVFKKDSEGKWRCVIDNSYGAELLEDVK